MIQKWTNPAYTSISRKTRPTHLPSDVPFRRLRTHHVQEQFEYASDLQRPGQRVLDTFPDRIIVDTHSPKKDMDSFKAWVENLKQEIEQMHQEPRSVVIYTDGAFHHSDYRAAFAFTIFQNGLWYDQYDWCPAASSFDAELRAIEAALAYLTTRTLCDRATIFVDNKAAANSLFNFDVKSSQMSIIRINMLLDAWLAADPERIFSVRFTPSHQGVTGNERADELTKAGLRLCPMNPPRILRSHFLSIYRRRAEHDWQRRHRFFVSYHHHPPSLSTLPPLPAFSDPSFLSDSWTTMRRKSPSSSTKPSSRAPPPSKILSPLASPPLSALPNASSLPRALSASPSGVRASPVLPENLWDNYPDSHWEVDNDIYCDSMGCSYDAHKNPRPATVAATVIEFDDCSYQEYEDTLFLCKICNISCRRSVNKSKIKSKMPLEEFLRRQRSEDDSFSPEAIDLPLRPPSAADFPPLAPRPAPKSSAPKLTKVEKATQGKINALLASTPLPVKLDTKHRKAPSPAIIAKTPEPPIRKILERPATKIPPEHAYSPPTAVSPAPSPVPNVIPSASPDRAPSPVTPILAVAALQVAHSGACPHDPNTCAICRVGITCCKCQTMYTAPGAKRMRCSACLHWACDLDDSEACCSYSEEEDEFCFFLGSTLAAIPDLGETLNVEVTCQGLSNLIVEKWNSLTKTPLTSRPHGTSWWNDQCQAYRDAYDLNRSKENLKAYNAVTRKARAAFFEEKIAIMTAIKKPWEGVRWTRPRAPPPYSTIEIDGQAPRSVDDLFDIMHAQFSQAAARSPSREEIEAILEALPTLPERSFPAFSCQEIQDAISLTSNSSAPGPDHVTWELLKRALQVSGAPEGLCHLYNQISSNGVWPSWFKESTCVIIPKPNKPRYNVPKAFRPISLLNTMGKLLTKIIATRMQFDCLKYDILHPGQCGGVAMHATIDAGTVLASFVSDFSHRFPTKAAL
ncbi:hypothetical protein AX14_005390 [Amanita brunnescens Koide BX004]|nr:hypothetical protein AX14_005390 [Amanita brunnescens Koide BX004]